MCKKNYLRLENTGTGSSMRAGPSQTQCVDSQNIHTSLTEGAVRVYHSLIQANFQ